MLAGSSIFPGGTIGDLLTKWEEIGFFSYLLPFMLIFALIFGILTKVNIFQDNKMVNGIIALAVALMALQFDFVPSFFAAIFPRLGVGLAIIFGVLIIAGFFMDPESNMVNYFLLGIGVLVIGLVLIQSAGEVGWASGEWWEQNWQMVIGAVFIFVLVAIVIGGSKSQDEKGHYKPHIWRSYGPGK